MATMTLVPLTELDAVNIILEVSGDQPVNAIDPSVPDSEIAQLILHNASRELQIAGWSFNKDIEFEMALDGNSKVPIADNILDIDGFYRTDRFVQRGAFLYDVSNQTFVFTSAPSCNVVWFQPFDELPAHARNLITIIAARRYQKRTVGSELLDGFTAEDELRARALFTTKEMDTEDNNMLQGPSQHRIWRNRR